MNRILDETPADFEDFYAVLGCGENATVRFFFFNDVFIVLVELSLKGL